MDERRLNIRRWTRPDRLMIRMCVVVVLFASATTVRSEEYRDPCDSSKSSWQVAFDRNKAVIDRHERDGYEFYSGTAAEAVRISSKGDTYVRLSHPVPRSLVIDELKTSLWVRSNRAGAVLATRITLPHENDPQTGEPLAFDLRGDEYTSTQRWQQLTCQTKGESIERQLKLLRGRLARVIEGRTLDTSDMHVSEVVLVIPAQSGTSEVLLDELSYGPIVRTDINEAKVVPAGLDSRNERPTSPISVETNRMLVNGKPFFPRIVPYHGENLETLNGSGINVAWVEHYDDQILIDALKSRGIWSMASPPQGEASSNGVIAPAGLMPIPISTSSILFWNVGTRVPPRDLDRVANWIDRLRDADRAFASPRPVLADVIGEERRFSRYVSLLGSSRHTLHTGISPLQYRDYLTYRKNLALPDRFNWTWIQLEPADGNVVTRTGSRSRPVIVEAEQIWLQSLAAISAGHKALGYWKSEPLDAVGPGAEEQRLSLAILNSQIDLLEPWLATGKVVDTVPVKVNLKHSTDLGSRGYGFRNALMSRREQHELLAERDRAQAEAARVRTEVQATIIESSYGRLVIPTWFEEGAQFQPGQLAAQDATILVRNADYARGWLVTTTGVTSIDMKRVTGGMQIDLPIIDQSAFVVITTDSGLEEKLFQKVRTMRKRCGQLWVALAKARLARVKETHAEIEATAAPKISDAPFLLTSATNLVDQAQQELLAEQYAEARRLSRNAMQLLRKLQRTHWENAVADLTSPTASPHTVCFNTLPDHWRLVSAIGRGGGDIESNLLRSGSFEDLDAMAADGWEQLRTAVADPQRKTAELSSSAAEGDYCLRLRSTSARGALPTEQIGPNVVVAGPKVAVRGGQILLISGRLHIDEIDEADIDGLMVYESINGTVGALRWRQPSADEQWQSFEILREVAASRDVQLMFELHGDGDVRIDDVRMVTLENTTLQVGGRSATSGPGQRRNLLDFAPTFPKVNLWPGRKSDDQPNSDPPEAVPQPAP